MGSFHGRRKPTAKKPSKSQGPTAEEVAAKQAREEFIKAMAEKALPSPIDSDTGGIHPSRLARADPGNGGYPNRDFSQHAQRSKPARGSRAPDLRKQGTKRTFDDSDAAASPNGQAQKKQRTLDEIKKLKGPAAMRKEEEKRRKKAEAEREARKNAAIPDVVAEPTVNSEEDDTPIPSRNGKKAVTAAPKVERTADEKERCKLEKLARKAAKKAASNGDMFSTPQHTTSTDASAEPEEESKEAKKARKKAEKAAKSLNDAALDKSDPALTLESNKEESKAEKKERKRLAKLSASSVDPVQSDTNMHTDDEKAAKKARKLAKKAAKADNSAPSSGPATSSSSVSKVSHPQTRSQSFTSTWTAAAASSLGARSSKFMKLMGGGSSSTIQSAADATKPQASSSTSTSANLTNGNPSGVKSSTAALQKSKNAEREIERQYTLGMAAKQNGRKRGGLGA